MNIGRMMIVTLIFGLLGQLYVYADQPLTLAAKDGFYQFPFCDTKIPVWSYHDLIPVPIIRSNVGPTLVINFVNGLKEPSSIH